MKKRISIVFLLFSGLLLTGCVSVQVKDNIVSGTSANQSDYLMQAVLWQQNAAEYRALCYQAYNMAKMQLNEILDNEDFEGKDPVVVTDIDETVLNNSPYEAKLIKTGNSYSSETWADWVQKAEAKAVPGAVEFLNYAKSRGVEVFYVSNRHQKGEQATIENLKKLGFPYADKAHVLLKTTTSAKKGRFEKVAEQHAIILFVGDNLSDFTSEFRVPSTQKRNALADELQNQFGRRLIVLPNPMYGDWENKGLFKGRHDWTEAQKDSIRRAALKTY